MILEREKCLCGDLHERYNARRDFCDERRSLPSQSTRIVPAA